MQHHHLSMDQVLKQRSDYMVSPPALCKKSALVFLLVGAVSSVACIAIWGIERFWLALLLNSFFFFSISLGGAIFSAMQDVVGALWCRPIQRIQESLASYLPIAGGILLLLLLFAGLDLFSVREIYPWMSDEGMLKYFPGKRDWLLINSFVIRDIVTILLLLGLVWWQLSLNLRRDRAVMKSGQLSEESTRVKNIKRYWSAPVLIVYALGYSLLAFDLIMSLFPAWFSTLWPVWMFAILMQTMMATLLISLFIFKSTALGKVYNQSHFHDVGKLLHGFTIFFAYLTFAHVLTYWYGNMPEFTEMFIERLQGSWIYMVCIVPLFVFVLPLYTLLIKRNKWNVRVAVPLAGIILTAQWFTYVVVVAPTMDGHYWTGALVDVSLLILNLGLFTKAQHFFIAKFPMLSVGDPLLGSYLEEQAGGH